MDEQGTEDLYNGQDSKNETDSKNRGPEASSFPTPPSDSPKNSLKENQMSAQEYYPRKNSLLTGDLGSAALYGVQSTVDIGLDKKSGDNYKLLVPVQSLNGNVAPPGLVKAPCDDFGFGNRRMSTPNHLLESIQKNTSSSQEAPWAPADRVLNQIWTQGDEKSPDKSLNLLPRFLEDGLDSPPPRATRSFSFSVNNSDSKGSDSGFMTPSGSSPPMLASSFSRSKSISCEPARQGEGNDIFDGFSAMSLTQRASIATSDIWNPAPSDAIRTNFAPLYHRRASTQPASTPVWVDGEVMDPVIQEGNIMMSQEQIDRYREQRKFTHAPTLMKEYIQRFNMARGSDGALDMPYENIRRHSVSSPVLDARKLQNNQASAQIRGQEENEVKPSIVDINDYFENTENRTKAWAQAGKNLQAIASRTSTSSSVDSNNMNYNWPIYVVEFKAGRTDFFYISDGLEVKIGDLVIVEADRGKDLGKVVENSIYSMEELIQFKQKMEAKMPELYNGKTCIVPKCIYRLAQPSETTMLFVKSEDERKAMASCQQKIIDRNLPMEIVDTEYQW